MRRFILTGTPGAGKTAILRQLEHDGFVVVEEAATDVIALERATGVAEPWTHSSFIDSVIVLQRQRLVRASQIVGDIQFHDRSAICTAALATYLGYPRSELLRTELERIEAQAIYQRRVFFIRNLGFATPTEARRISFEEALRFEAIHKETYRAFGYDLVFIAPAPLPERVTEIERAAGIIPPRCDPS